MKKSLMNPNNKNKDYVKSTNKSSVLGLNTLTNRDSLLLPSSGSVIDLDASTPKKDQKNMSDS